MSEPTLETLQRIVNDHVENLDEVQAATILDPKVGGPNTCALTTALLAVAARSDGLFVFDGLSVDKAGTGWDIRSQLVDLTPARVQAFVGANDLQWQWMLADLRNRAPGDDRAVLVPPMSIVSTIPPGLSPDEFNDAVMRTMGGPPSPESSNRPEPGE